MPGWGFSSARTFVLGALGDPGVPGRWRWREWGEEDGVLRIDGVRGGAGENMPPVLLLLLLPLLWPVVLLLPLLLLLH